MKKGKSKQKNIESITQNKNNEKENIVRPVGTYNGFLIYNKTDEK